MESCEGCDQLGSIDWCGHWLCSVCYQIEREHADPMLAAINEEARRASERKALVDSWPASYRGDSRGFMVDWNMRNVRHAERVQAFYRSPDCHAQLTLPRHRQ